MARANGGARDAGTAQVLHTDGQVLAQQLQARRLRGLQRQWRSLLDSPAFSAEDKAKGLTAVAAKAGFQLLTAKFLGLVASNGRAGDLAGAINAFLGELPPEWQQSLLGVSTLARN